MNPAAGAADTAFLELGRKLFERIVAPLGAAPPGFSEILRSLAASAVEDAGRWRELQERYYRKQLELWAAYVLAGGHA
ncbi:MAG TPA: hypothetical protein VNK67_12925, partial [Burkholderiales bacterium]|nr:hypothetical protein [Burkholderiales bacterium]